MKTVFNNRELCHVWAQQKQETGKGSNMFFEGTRIYSYGRHFCIANFIKPGIVLYNSNRYSNSTSKQQSYVSRALHGHSLQIFSVPSPEGNHIENLKYYVSGVAGMMEAALKSTKNSSYYLSNAEGFRTKGLEYAKTFKVLKYAKDLRKPILISEELHNRIASQQEKARIKKEREEREQQKAIEEARLYLPKWFDGEQLRHVRLSVLPESYLRVNGNMIETSHGARVALQSGKRLFDRIQRNEDVRGHEIDHYTVVKLNGVLQVGCHTIERSEIERFAKSQGWI